MEAGLDQSIIGKRIESLRAEMEGGQHRLAELEAELAFVRDNLLRIGGAIQALEELASEASPEA